MSRPPEKPEPRKIMPKAQIGWARPRVHIGLWGMKRDRRWTTKALCGEVIEWPLYLPRKSRAEITCDACLREAQRILNDR